MRSRVARIVRTVALAGALVLPVGLAHQAHAGTEATVSVTGAIVSTELSLSLNTTTFSFGDISLDGTTSNGSATPYSLPNNPMFGIDGGTAWFADTPVQATINSPGAYRVLVCASASTNMILQGSTIPHLTLTEQLPPDPGSTIGYLGHQVLPCSVGVPFGPTGSAGTTQTLLYPVYRITAADTPGAISATIQLTLTALP